MKDRDNMDKITAYGEAAVQLKNISTGQVIREVTAQNQLNLDYVAEIKNNLFNPTSAMTLYLSEYDLPPPANGLFFPMGRFLGFGRYNSGSSSTYQGVWNTAMSKSNQQKNGLTTNTFSWDFTPSQAIGTLRSLFLYLDASITRYPALMFPVTAWKGMPRCSFGNKLFDATSKGATEYYIGDFHTKDLTLLQKNANLSVTGLAYEPDTGHVFAYDGSDKKIYEYANIDTAMTAANVLAEYPCTQAYFSRGLVRGGNLFYITNSSSPANTNVGNYSSAATVYMHRYPYKTDGVPELMDSMTYAETGYSNFSNYLIAAFIDDYLVYHYSTSNANIVCCPVLRLAGNSARMGITGVAPANASNFIQRMSPDRQIILSGTTANASFNSIIPMAISHLLLPEPFVKDNAHSMTVSYTISIQE